MIAIVSSLLHCSCCAQLSNSTGGMRHDSPAAANVVVHGTAVPAVAAPKDLHVRRSADCTRRLSVAKSDDFDADREESSIARRQRHDTVARASSAWTTDRQIEYRFDLAPAPSPFPTRQAYYNASTWSWGGALIHVPDDPRGFPFHLFAEAEANSCGVHAWGTNARVVHAVSRTAEGPFEYSDHPFKPWEWRAGPDIARAADGTFLLMTMAQDFPYATAVNCTDGIGDYMCDVNGTLKESQYPCEPHAHFRNRLYSSHSPYGPWSEVHNSTGGDVIPATINANGVVHAMPNGTVIIFGGGIHVAQNWSGPYVRQNRSLRLNDPKTGKLYDFKACPSDPRNAANHARWPKAICALEDIFVWFDQARQRWRWMAHQKYKGAGSRTEHQCSYFAGVVGFAQSDTPDLWGPWTYDFWAPAAGLNVTLSNGTRDYCLESRERPKIAVLENRTFLTNSACPTVVSN
eukprot:SAG31_NODE_2559_length_5487_cov_68.463066_3_plen_460_part_00